MLANAAKSTISLKKQLRVIAKKKREDFYNEQGKLAIEETIRIFKNDVFPIIEGHQKPIISGYWPLNTELDIRPILNFLLEKGIECCLPCLQDDNKGLIFRKYLPETKLVETRFGLLQPSQNYDIVEPNIILMPLLGFSLNGDRIGYGMGYYDYTIHYLRQKKSVISIGIGFAIQEFEDIPSTAHDEKLDFVLTDKKLHRILQKS